MLTTELTSPSPGECHRAGPGTEHSDTQVGIRALRVLSLPCSLWILPFTVSTAQSTTHTPLGSPDSRSLILALHHAPHSARGPREARHAPAPGSSGSRGRHEHTEPLGPVPGSTYSPNSHPSSCSLLPLLERSSSSCPWPSWFFPDLSPCRHPSFLPRVCLNSCSCRRLRRHRLLSLGARITLGCHCLWNVPFFPRRLSAPKGWLSPAVLMPPQPHIPFHSTGPGIYNQFHSFIQQLFAQSCFATPWPSQ